jgi:uncharacterized integral membrane protein (TIGR00697 family)
MSRDPQPRHGAVLGVPQVALVALFVTALVAAQVTAAKVVAVDPPVGLPLAGDPVLVPGAVFAYALTFFASDCYAELYGRRATQVLVNVAFTMNFVLLGVVWLAIAAPVFQGSPVGQEAFVSVLGASTGVVLGSLVAYAVSQNWDVVVFHRIRGYTGSDHLWLRNVASTATSQLIDTVIFVTIVFLVFQGLPVGQVLGLIVGQYAVKLGIALLDTPFVYAVVGFVRSRGLVGPAAPSRGD